MPLGIMTLSPGLRTLGRLKSHVLLRWGLDGNFYQRLLPYLDISKRVSWQRRTASLGWKSPSTSLRLYEYLLPKALMCHKTAESIRVEEA